MAVRNRAPGFDRASAEEGWNCCRKQRAWEATARDLCGSWCASHPGWETGKELFIEVPNIAVS